MRKKVCSIMLSCAIFLLPLGVYAEQEELSYTPLRKVARGAVNFLFGWLEIPKQIGKVNSEKGDLAGVFWGPLKGIRCFLQRSWAGIVEMTTFLIPPYEPRVEPEFIFEED
jgi:putative exosortase-associated protein (TIGR04073 family)